MTDQIIMFISQLFNGLKIGSVYADRKSVV